MYGGHKRTLTRALAIGAFLCFAVSLTATAQFVRLIINADVAGFSTWFTGTVQYTLSNSNLTIDRNGTGNYKITTQSTGRVTGQFYYEFVCTTIVGANYGMGALNVSSPTESPNVIGESTASFVYRSDTNFAYNFIYTAGSWDGCVNGDRVGIALDLTNLLVYARTYHSGAWGAKWNVTTEAQPVAGGYAISSMSTPIFPAFSTGTAGDTVTICSSPTSCGMGPLPTGYLWWE